jgi:non-heme chloroperoxidase
MRGTGSCCFSPSTVTASIALDRRGHGRFSQPANGNDMNGSADDLAAVIEALDLRGATLVGHSTAGGEVAHYIGRHGTERVAKAALISAVPPIMVQSDANPEGLPIDVFDGLRAGWSRIARSSTRTSRLRSTVPTSPAPMSL